MCGVPAGVVVPELTLVARRRAPLPLRRRSSEAFGLVLPKVGEIEGPGKAQDVPALVVGVPHLIARGFSHVLSLSWGSGSFDSHLNPNYHTAVSRFTIEV